MSKRKQELEGILSEDMKEMETVAETNAQKKQCIRELITNRLKKIKTEVEDFNIILEKIKIIKKTEEARQLDQSMFHLSMLIHHIVM